VSGARRVYLDTNVFIALKEGSGPIGELLIELLSRSSRTGQLQLATSELTLAELLAKPYAEHRNDLVDQYDNWIVESDWLAVGPVTREVLWYSAVLRSQYRTLKLPDAIHVSTALGMQCSHILTADRGIKENYSIVHTRYGVARAGGDLTTIRPSEDALSQLLAELQ